MGADSPGSDDDDRGDDGDGPEALAFQLPILGLYADVETGRGSVSLPDEFTACSGAVQLEIIRDWQHGLRAYRQRALGRLYRELCEGEPLLTSAERLSRLRSTCDSLGIELTGDDLVADMGPGHRR